MAHCKPRDEDVARYPDVEPAGRRTYCAMVDCLDQNVGRLMEHLEKTKEADNTVIIFMNDNGGSNRDGTRTQRAILGA